MLCFPFLLYKNSKKVGEEGYILVILKNILSVEEQKPQIYLIAYNSLADWLYFNHSQSPNYTLV